MEGILTHVRSKAKGQPHTQFPALYKVSSTSIFDTWNFW